MEKKLISLKEVVGEFKISSATVNYYTNLGLLNIAQKEGNKRLYDRQEVSHKINLIRELRNKGYTLRLIKEKFSNPDSKDV